MNDRFSRGLTAPATVLVGDFGGGTSDFSIFRFEPGERHRVHQPGHAGIGIAGDTFDYRLLDQIICPLLGKDDTYRIMGKDMPIPISYYRGLAQWHRLSLMRTPSMLADIRDLARTASHPERIRALVDIIEGEAGYEMYRAISGLKASLSQSPFGNAPGTAIWRGIPAHPVLTAIAAALLRCSENRTI